MNLANELFRCLVKSISKEIGRLQECGVLDRCRGQQQHAHVLNSILKEDALRLFALRELYESLPPAEASRVTFDAECHRDEGRIDLVLAEGAEEYGFEFKRWQTTKESQEILGSDHEKLVSFMRAYANHHGYSVIFTVNENKDIFTVNENKDIASDFRHQKQSFYEDAFERYLGEKYHLCDCSVIEFGTFTVCALLATPRQDVRGT